MKFFEMYMMLNIICGKNFDTILKSKITTVFRGPFCPWEKCLQKAAQDSKLLFQKAAYNMYIFAGFFLASNSDGHWSRSNKLAAISDTNNLKTIIAHGES
jgi:hypothetical protein